MEHYFLFLKHLLTFSQLLMLHETHMGNDDLHNNYIVNGNMFIDKHPCGYDVRIKHFLWLSFGGNIRLRYPLILNDVRRVPG